MKSFLYIIKDFFKIFILFFFLNDILLLEWNIENKINIFIFYFVFGIVYKMFIIYLIFWVLYVIKMKY